MTMKQSFSQNEKVPIYYKDIENQLFLSNEKNNTKNKRAQEFLFLSRFEKIRNKNAIKLYKFFLTKGASFAKELEVQCGVSSATAYRVIDDLIKLDLVVPLSKMRMRKSSGMKPTLYGLSDCTKEETIEAGNRYLKSRRKTYRHVIEVKQLTLNDIKDQEIQFQKIIWKARKYGNNNFHFMDIAEQVALELHYEGVKVLR